MAASPQASMETTAVAGGGNANIGMFQGAPFPMDATGHPSSSAFTSLCTKTTDFQSFASTYGGAWRTLYKFDDGGIWADHSRAEFTGYTSGASGSTATLNVSGTQFGSTSSLAASTVISGTGLCANSVCPTVTSGSSSTYTLSFGAATAQNVGSIGSPIPMRQVSISPQPRLLRSKSPPQSLDRTRPFQPSVARRHRPLLVSTAARRRPATSRRRRRLARSRLASASGMAASISPSNTRSASRAARGRHGPSMVGRPHSTSTPLSPRKRCTRPMSRSFPAHMSWALASQRPSWSRATGR